VNTERWNVTFAGKVQGVFFRANTQEKAEQLGLTGSVKNMPDGTVEAEIQGPPDKIEQLIQWCKSKSGPGNIEGFEIKKADVKKNEKHFEIER